MEIEMEKKVDEILSHYTKERDVLINILQEVQEAFRYLPEDAMRKVACFLGIPVSQVRSLGGGSRSPLWLQIKADVLQKPIQTVQVEEAASLGAAILGAVACGAYASLPEAVNGMVHVKDLIMPNPSHQGVYQHRYGQYLELYDRLLPMFVEE